MVLQGMRGGASWPQARFFLGGTGAGSALALGAAFVAQYGFSLYPCHLCLLQRYPHAAVAVVALAGVYGARGIPTLRLFLLACIALLLIGGGIAAYHSGVEQGVFAGPESCVSHSTGEETLEEMRAQIINAPLVSCGQPMGEVGGLSLAVWSMLIYAFLIIFASYGYRRSLCLDQPL